MNPGVGKRVRDGGGRRQVQILTRGGGTQERDVERGSWLTESGHKCRLGTCTRPLQARRLGMDGWMGGCGAMQGCADVVEVAKCMYQSVTSYQRSVEGSFGPSCEAIIETSDMSGSVRWRV